VEESKEEEGILVERPNAHEEISALRFASASGLLSSEEREEKLPKGLVAMKTTGMADLREEYFTEDKEGNLKSVSIIPVATEVADSEDEELEGYVQSISPDDLAVILKNQLAKQQTLRDVDWEGVRILEEEV